MGDWIGPIIAVIVVLVVMLPLRHWLFAKIWSGTPIAEWHDAAQWIPWRTRLKITWANDRGIATAPEHAALAARRAQLILDQLDNRRQSGRSRLRTWVLGAIYVFLVASNAILAYLDHNWWNSLLALLWAYLGVQFLGPSWITARRRRLLRRSRDRNIALLDPTSALSAGTGSH